MFELPKKGMFFSVWETAIKELRFSLKYFKLYGGVYAPQ